MAPLPASPEIATERLHMSLPGPEAAQRVVDYYQRNLDHLKPWEPPFAGGMFTVAFWQRRLELNRKEYRQRLTMRLVLFDRATPEGPIVGLANFTQFVRGAFTACTLGYSLDAQAQGKGLMHEALEAAIAHVFDELEMHRVMANYMPINERSGRLLRRLGFVVEGYARDYIYIDGAWRDHILTSLTNPAATLPEYLRRNARVTRP